MVKNMFKEIKAKPRDEKTTMVNQFGVANPQINLPANAIRVQIKKLRRFMKKKISDLI